MQNSPKQYIVASKMDPLLFHCCEIVPALATTERHRFNHSWKCWLTVRGMSTSDVGELNSSSVSTYQFGGCRFGLCFLLSIFCPLLKNTEQLLKQSIHTFRCCTFLSIWKRCMSVLAKNEPNLKLVANCVFPNFPFATFSNFTSTLPTSEIHRNSLTPNLFYLACFATRNQFQ